MFELAILGYFVTSVISLQFPLYIITHYMALWSMIASQITEKYPYRDNLYYTSEQSERENFMHFYISNVLYKLV